MKLTLTLWLRQQDTVLSVWDGATPLSNGSNLVGCNDDSCGAESRLSQVTVTLTAGTPYTITMSQLRSAFNWPSTPINLTIVSSGDGSYL
jgi:hypothetical protein